MLLTATQLTYRALRLIGQLRTGYGSSPEALADGLMMLNDILDTWSIDRLLIYTIGDSGTTYIFPSSKQSYSIGPSGADFIAPRPNKIESANIWLQGTTPPTRQPLQIIDSMDWSAIQVPGISTSIPIGLYYDNQYPNGNLYLWPYPTTASQIELFTWTALQQFADLVTGYNFPPGYSELLKYALAVSMISMFPKGTSPLFAEVKERYREIKQTVMANNAPSPMMQVETPFTTQIGAWNYLTGLPI